MDGSNRLFIWNGEGMVVVPDRGTTSSRHSTYIELWGTEDATHIGSITTLTGGAAWKARQQVDTSYMFNARVGEINRKSGKEL